MNYVRSKNAHIQLARTLQRLNLGENTVAAFIDCLVDDRCFLDLKTSAYETMYITTDVQSIVTFLQGTR